MTRVLPLLLLVALSCSSKSRQSAGDVVDHRAVDAAEVLDEVADTPDVGAPEDVRTQDLVETRSEDIPPPPQEIRVATFNLRTGLAQDGPDSWKHRADLVVEVFADMEADLVGVQEAWIFQLEYIREALPAYDWVGISRAGSDLEEFCAIFYRKERFDVLESGTFWLSETPDVRSKFPGQDLPRICTWVRLQPVDGSPEVYMYNTHFTHLNLPEAKLASAALILDTMTAHGALQGGLLTGDFNTGPDSETWHALVQQDGTAGPLVDPWLELGLDEEGTFHGFSGEPKTARIDWVLHGPQWTAVEALVVKNNQDGSYPSDHFPVVVDLVR